MKRRVLWGIAVLLVVAVALATRSALSTWTSRKNLEAVPPADAFNA